MFFFSCTPAPSYLLTHRSALRMAAPSCLANRYCWIEQICSEAPPVAVTGWTESSICVTEYRWRTEFSHNPAAEQHMGQHLLQRRIWWIIFGPTSYHHVWIWMRIKTHKKSAALYIRKSSFKSFRLISCQKSKAKTELSFKKGSLPLTSPNKILQGVPSSQFIVIRHSESQLQMSVSKLDFFLWAKANVQFWDDKIKWMQIQKAYCYSVLIRNVYP